MMSYKCRRISENDLESMRFSTIQQIMTLQKTALPIINPSRPDPG